MILFCHLLVGAVIAAKIQITPLVFLFAFLSHYLLDFLPHLEYSIDNVLERRWRKAKCDFLKVGLDFSVGILFILAISKNEPIIFAGAFFGILPDGLTLLVLLFPNRLLKIHENFHRRLVHYFKKISLRGNKILFLFGIFSQILVSILSILFLIS